MILFVVNHSLDHSTSNLYFIAKAFYFIFTSNGMNEPKIPSTSVLPLKQKKSSLLMTKIMILKSETENLEII